MQGACTVPCFAPSSAEVAAGLLGLFVSCCPEFAPTVHAVIFSPLEFLCILLFEEMFVQVQVLQQSVPSPACLITVPK